MPSGSISPRPQADGLAVRASEALSPRPLAGEGPGVRAASLRPRPNPYVQVALTYLRRPLAYWPAVVLIAIVVGLNISLLARCSWDNNGHFLLMPLMAVALATGVLTIHVKDQFAESRSHVMPRFRRIHFMVATAAVLGLIAATYGLLSLPLGIQSIGLLSIIVLLVGVMSWSVLHHPTWFIWSCVLIPWFGMSDQANRVLNLIVSGQFEFQAFGLLAIGATILTLAGSRLFHLNEEMPEYHRQMPTSWSKKGRMTGQNINYDGPWPRMLTDWFRHQAMRHLTRQAQRAECSRWSRICRWQLGMATGWRLWLWAIFPIAFQQFMLLYVPHRSPTDAPIRFVANSFVLLPIVLVPGQAFGWLTWHTQLMPRELMLTVDRRAYVQQFVMALTLGYFQLWGVLCIATALWWLAAVAPSPPLAYLGAVVVVALSAQMALFGVITLVWSITSSRAVQVVVCTPCVCASAMLVFRGCDDLHFQLRPEILPIAFGAAALGVLLTYIAYRRWLVADFD